MISKYIQGFPFQEYEIKFSQNINMKKRRKEKGCVKNVNNYWKAYQKTKY